jgi:uncharacterized protein YprB with RNaseH-like and TPR domain
METLSDKLKSLGVHLGAPKPKEKLEKVYFPVEDIVSGVYRESVFGRSFVHSEDYSLDYLHGTVQICELKPISRILAWSGLETLADVPFNSILFLDTETSGLSGGTGTLVFMVGIGFLREDGFHVEQFFLSNPDQETQFLNSISESLSPFSVLVTYNGKAFDAPLLNTRFDLNNITSPIRSFSHIDLLPLARRIWKYRLESRSLKNIETEILKTQRTQEEIPGWEIPQIYFDYLRSEDARPLKGVFYHNAMDVLSLAALFQFLAGFTDNPFSIPAPDSIDLVALANLYEDLGDLEAAARYYEIGLNEHLPGDLHHKTLERFARMHRKTRNWEKALQLWQSGYSEDDLYSLIELAKFYEHHEKSPEKALDFAQIALQITKSNKKLTNVSAFTEAEIKKRITRLKGKIRVTNSKQA